MACTMMVSTASRRGPEVVASADASNASDMALAMSMRMIKGGPRPMAAAIPA
jgi:hypothetical protein